LAGGTGHAPRMRSPRRALVVAAATAALVAAGCGEDGGGSDGRTIGSRSAPVTEFTIVAEDLRFDLARVVVPAGEEITATIDNRDGGIGHNLRVRLDPDDAATEVEDGPVRQTLRFTVPEPGAHEFVCDPHAARMTGTVEAV
jgi:plastocyanin